MQKLILLVSPSHDAQSIKDWLRRNSFAGLKELESKGGCKRYECIETPKRCTKKERETLAQMVSNGTMASHKARAAS